VVALSPRDTSHRLCKFHSFPSEFVVVVVVVFAVSVRRKLYRP